MCMYITTFFSCRRLEGCGEHGQGSSQSQRDQRSCDSGHTGELKAVTVGERLVRVDFAGA